MRSSLFDVYARTTVYALFLATLFGCANANNSSTPSTSSSTKPNASSSTISVIDKGGNRLQEAKVTLSTGLNGVSPSGTIIGREMTGDTGQAVFNGIPAQGQICASATDFRYAPTGACRQPFPSALTLKL
ncbi:MAG: hypothetical protein WB615_00045 [Candidatus Tumulicola sp.]